MNKLYFAQPSLSELDPRDFIAVSAEVGFDGVGLRLHPSPPPFGGEYHPVLGNPALIRDIKRLLTDSGLEVLDIFSFYLEPHTDVATFMPAIELGAELGGRFLLVQGYDPDWNRMRDSYAALCDRAAPFGISPAIEFMPARPLATLQLAEQLIRESGRSNTAILIDPLHLARSCGVPADVKAVDSKYFPYVQLSDGVLPPGEPDPSLLGKPMSLSERRLLGEGTMPVAELMAALPAGLPISVEIANRSGTTMPARDWAEAVITSTRRFLARL